MAKHQLSSGYSCIIKTLCSKGKQKKALEVLQDILSRGLFISPGSFRILIDTQFKQNKTKGVLDLLQLVEKSEMDVQYVLYNDSIAFLCKNKSFEMALDVYMFMRNKGVGITDKSYYVILKNLLVTGKVQLALPILNSYLKEFGIFGRRIMKIISLNLCRKNADAAVSYLTDMGWKKVSAAALARVVDTLVKEGRPKDAQKFILEAQQNGAAFDVVSYSMVVNAFCKEGHLEKALDLCATMKKRGIPPNIVTYNSIMDCLCRQGCLVEAFRLFDALERNDIQATSITYGILLDALTRKGYMEDANKLFQRMRAEHIDANLHILNSLIYGYSSCGLMEQSLQLFGDLEKNGLEPDHFTVSALLSGFYLNGDMEVALSFYSTCKGKGFLPDIFGFSTLTKGLCRNGRMEEARSILRNMLQCPSVTSLINKAGNEIGMESLESVLDVLSEEGRITDAIKLLSGVTYVCFTRGRHNRIPAASNLYKVTPSTVTGREKLPTNMNPQPEKNDSLHLNCSTEEIPERASESDKMGRDDRRHGDETVVTRYDFDTYYHLISAYCSEGEMQKVNDVVREMLLDFNERN